MSLHETEEQKQALPTEAHTQIPRQKTQSNAHAGSQPQYHVKNMPIVRTLTCWYVKYTPTLFEAFQANDTRAFRRTLLFWFRGSGSHGLSSVSKRTAHRNCADKLVEPLRPMSMDWAITRMKAVRTSTASEYATLARSQFAAATC